MAYTAIGLREKKGLSLSQQSGEQITQRFTQYENNTYKANFLIRDEPKTNRKCSITYGCSGGVIRNSMVASRNYTKE